MDSSSEKFFCSSKFPALRRTINYATLCRGELLRKMCCRAPPSSSAVQYTLFCTTHTHTYTCSRLDLPDRVMAGQGPAFLWLRPRLFKVALGSSLQHTLKLEKAQFQAWPGPHKSTIELLLGASSGLCVEIALLFERKVQESRQPVGGW